jgi:hypothetical protein
LAGCVNIIGHGLEPIRGSLVLEQIDLSLIGEPLISEDAVLPILESIVAAGGTTLEHVALPRSWHYADTQKVTFVQFVERYNQVLQSRNAKGSQCI